MPRNFHRPSSVPATAEGPTIRIKALFDDESGFGSFAAVFVVLGLVDWADGSGTMFLSNGDPAATPIKPTKETIALINKTGGVFDDNSNAECNAGLLLAKSKVINPIVSRPRWYFSDAGSMDMFCGSIPSSRFSFGMPFVSTAEDTLLDMGAFIFVLDTVLVATRSSKPAADDLMDFREDCGMLTGVGCVKDFTSWGEIRKVYNIDAGIGNFMVVVLAWQLFDKTFNVNERDLSTNHAPQEEALLQQGNMVGSVCHVFISLFFCFVLCCCWPGWWRRVVSNNSRLEDREAKHQVHLPAAPESEGRRI